MLLYVKKWQSSDSFFLLYGEQNSRYDQFKVNNSPNAPLWNNYKLTLNGKPLKNELWESKGIRTIGDLINTRDRKLKYFAKLSDSYRIDDKDDLIHMQIRSHLMSYFGEVVKISTVSEPEIILESMFKQKHKIAPKLYKMLNSPKGNNWNMVQRNWETDLDRPLGMENWSQIWKDWHKISKSVKNKMIHFNIIHRTYFSPVWLHSMNSSVSDCCWNCQQEKGTFFHMVWTPKIKSFWESVTQSLGGIIGHHVVCDPTLCLLNYMDKGARPKYNKQIIITGCITAKRLIATKWNDADHRKKEDGCKLS